jgi:hypothetical protein
VRLAISDNGELKIAVERYSNICAHNTRSGLTWINIRRGRR